MSEEAAVLLEAIESIRLDRLYGPHVPEDEGWTDAALDWFDVLVDHLHCPSGEECADVIESAYYAFTSGPR